MFHLEFRHAVATLDELDSGTTGAGYPLVHSRSIRLISMPVGPTPTRTESGTTPTRTSLPPTTVNLVGADFDVLPIPFRTELIPSSEHEQLQGALKILFLGDVREEKGFQLLPGLVGALFEDYLKTGKAGFIIQASIHQDEHLSGPSGCARGTRRLQSRTCRVVGHEGFVTQKIITIARDLARRALPLPGRAIRARSSGVLAEAIMAGKPTVVPAGSWLAGNSYPDQGRLSLTRRLLSGQFVRCATTIPGTRAGPPARDCWQRSIRQLGC